MKDPVKMKATQGTPRFVHLAKMRGATPSFAMPYKVRVETYWSLTDAEIVKRRILRRFVSYSEI